jgi:hypothetical protein
MICKLINDIYINKIHAGLNYDEFIASQLIQSELDSLMNSIKYFGISKTCSGIIYLNNEKNIILCIEKYGDVIDFNSKILTKLINKYKIRTKLRFHFIEQFLTNFFYEKSKIYYDIYYHNFVLGFNLNDYKLIDISTVKKPFNRNYIKRKYK